MTPALRRARPVSLPRRMEAREAEAFERRHVHAVYSAISRHFSRTRRAPWPRVREFLEACPPGALVLDCGCGNGRNLAAREAGAFCLGLDYCLPMLEEARAALPHADWAQGDALALPFADGAFDRVLCVAVLHHFAAEERRLACLRELLRCTAPGGRLLATVWASEQCAPGAAPGGPSGPDAPGGPAAEPGEPGGPGEPAQAPPEEAWRAAISGDALVPWTPAPGAFVAVAEPAAGSTAGSPAASPATSAPASEGAGERYYHFYHAGELRRQALQAGFCNCQEFWEAGNWTLLCEKPAGDARKSP